MKNPGAYRRHAAAIQQMRVAPGVKRPSYSDEYETADADTTEVRDAATAAKLAALDGYGRNHRIFDPDMKKAYGNTGAAAAADKQRWLAAKEDRENSMMGTVATPPSYSMQSGLPAYDQREQAIAVKLAALEGDGGAVPLVYKQAKKAEKPSYRDMLETNKNLNSHDRFKQYQSNLPNAAKADQEQNAVKKKAASPGMTEGNGGSGAVPLVYKQAKKAEKPSYRDMLEANKNSNSLERFKQYQSIIPNATKRMKSAMPLRRKRQSPV